MKVLGRQNSNLETGVALLELAITLPVLIFLIYGIIDFSLVIREQRVVKGALASSARTAATALSLKQVGVDPSESISLSSSESCSNFIQTYSSHSPPNNLNYMLKLESCIRLARLGINLSKWKVSANSKRDSIKASEDDFNVISVSVEAHKQGKSCLLCFGILNNYVEKAAATEVLREAW